MSYLLDKKTKRKKIFKITLGVLVLFILFYFWAGIWSGFSYLSGTIFHPVLSMGSKVGGKFQNLSSYFLSKNSLQEENQVLQTKLSTLEARLLDYNSLLTENENLKEVLNRKPEKMNMVLGAILSKPNQNAYDTLMIDAGLENGVGEGDMVFALGDVPLGRVVLAYPKFSKVILFSSAGERTSVIVSSKNIFMEIVGRGGGNFEMAIPKDLTLLKGDQAVIPGIHPYVLALVETTISDPRDFFTKAILRSPVNIWELKFVEVEI